MATRRPKARRESVFAEPRALPVSGQGMVLSIALLLLCASQVAYWATVQPGDSFHFPSYPFYAQANGADAIVAGIVGLTLSAGFGGWLTIALVLILRGNAKAWTSAAAGAALAATLGSTFFAAALGFALDLPRTPSLILIIVGLAAGVTIGGLTLFPNRKRR
jgi:hypothetical protein